jgi:tRNA threonylcarbamoyladenosine biosynthesis protein TsaE
MNETFRAATEAEMIEAGRRFAETLRGGEVVGLDGDLGAGKTHFCKGLVAGLGSEDAVTSPTFALVQEYRSGRLPVFHFDWYRLQSPTELDRIGWDEYLDEEGIVVVEWAEKFPDFLPSSAVRLRFSLNPDGSRLVAVSRP